MLHPCTWELSRIFSSRYRVPACVIYDSFDNNRCADDDMIYTLLTVYESIDLSFHCPWRPSVDLCSHGNMKSFCEAVWCWTCERLVRKECWSPDAAASLDLVICTAVEIYSRCIKYGTCSLHRQAGTYLNVVIHSPPLRSSSIWSIQCECRRVQYIQVQCFPETGTGMPALVLPNSCPFMQKLTCEIWAWKELWWSEFWTETFAFRLIFSSEEKWLFGSATVDKRVGSACFQNQTYLYFFETIELHRY